MDEELSQENKDERSTSIRDSVEFNAGAAYHQIVLPSIPIDYVDQPNDSVELNVVEHDTQPITAR